MRRFLPVLFLLAGCGAEAEIPAPPPERPRADVPPPPPKVSPIRTLFVDPAATWVEVSVESRGRTARPALRPTGGRVLVDASVEPPQVMELQIVLDDIVLSPELLPPNGLTIVGTTLTFTPTADERARMTVEWSVRDDGGDRPIRPIEHASVPFNVRVERGLDDGLTVTGDDHIPGTVWRLDGLFEVHDLSFGVVAE